MNRRIVVLPGDGIGPEVTREAILVLQATADTHGLNLQFQEHLIGGAALEATGDSLPDETLKACLRSQAILIGAVGGPQWDKHDPSPETGLLRLRQELGLYANLRPIQSDNTLSNASLIKATKKHNVDILIVRELSSGEYYGRPRGQKLTKDGVQAIDTTTYTQNEIRRIAHTAYTQARTRKKRLASIDKANVLATSVLWRDTVNEVAREYPEVETHHELIDAHTLNLIHHPHEYDVILTSNLFGDILSDLGAAIPGSLGLLPSASLSPRGPSLFEPVHGSAPSIAGTGTANPIGAILSAALLLENGLGCPEGAEGIRNAVTQELHEGYRTPDLGGNQRTHELAPKIMTRIDKAERADSG